MPLDNTDSCVRAGAALRIVRACKERTYPELLRAPRCRLVVLAIEVAGRWSAEAASSFDSCPPASWQHRCVGAEMVRVPSLCSRQALCGLADVVANSATSSPSTASTAHRCQSPACAVKAAPHCAQGPDHWWEWDSYSWTPSQVSTCSLHAAGNLASLNLTPQNPKPLNPKP